MIWLKLLGFWRVIWNWLSHASLWQIISLGLCALLLVQHFQLADARHDRDAYLKQRDHYKSELDSISSNRNEQKSRTSGNLGKAREGVVKAEERAKRVEAAPLPGQCRSPREVLEADI